MFTSNWPRSGVGAARIKAFAVCMCVISWFLPCVGGAQQLTQTDPPPKANLKSFLQSYLGKPEPKEDEDAQYRVAWVDLNDDGKQEAVVYVWGSSWCGTGGCVTLVLAPHEGTYRVVTKMTITRLPIRILPEKSHGWHDISVRVAGGGLSAHDARLRFNGEAYPINPSVAPAQPIKGDAQGRIIISPSDKNDQFIYR